MTGKIHSVETFGAADGPGVRFTVFMQGCPLRCVCCHNPDTWELSAGTEMSAEELADRAGRYKEYFGNSGGVTVSGGEPLLQAKFVAEFFKECHKRGINTCLDTSGCILNSDAEALLEQTDIVLLDIKYTNRQDYLNYVGCELSKPLAFLEYLENMGKPYWVRQVIIPKLNDSKVNIERLNKILENTKYCKRIELLPFRKLCAAKYENMGLDFPLKSTPEPNAETMERLKRMLVPKP